MIDGDCVGWFIMVDLFYIFWWYNCLWKDIWWYVVKFRICVWKVFCGWIEVEGKKVFVVCLIGEIFGVYYFGIGDWDWFWEGRDC